VPVTSTHIASVVMSVAAHPHSASSRRFVGAVPLPCDCRVDLMQQYPSSVSVTAERSTVPVPSTTRKRRDIARSLSPRLSVVA